MLLFPLKMSILDLYWRDDIGFKSTAHLFCVSILLDRCPVNPSTLLYLLETLQLQDLCDLYPSGGGGVTPGSESRTLCLLLARREAMAHQHERQHGRFEEVADDVMWQDESLISS